MRTQFENSGRHKPSRASLRSSVDHSGDLMFALATTCAMDDDWRRDIIKSSPRTAASWRFSSICRLHTGPKGELAEGQASQVNARNRACLSRSCFTPSSATASAFSPKVCEFPLSRRRRSKQNRSCGERTLVDRAASRYAASSLSEQGSMPFCNSQKVRGTRQGMQ